MKGDVGEGKRGHPGTDGANGTKGDPGLVGEKGDIGENGLSYAKADGQAITT